MWPTIAFSCPRCKAAIDTHTHAIATAEERVAKAGWLRKTEGGLCHVYYCPDCQKEQNS